MQYIQYTYTSYILLTYSSGVHSILFYSFYDPTAAPSSDASITSTLGLLPLWLVQPSRGAGSAAFSGRRTAPGWPAAPLRVSCPYGIVASQGSQGHGSHWPRWSSPLPWRSARASFRKKPPSSGTFMSTLCEVGSLPGSLFYKIHICWYDIKAAAKPFCNIFYEPLILRVIIRVWLRFKCMISYGYLLTEMRQSPTTGGSNRRQCVFV